MRRLARAVRRHLTAQVQEIAVDPALRGYGAALAAVHGLVAFWLLRFDVARLVAAGGEAICWPLVPDCEALRVLSAPALEIAFQVYAGVAAVVALGFLQRRRVPLAWMGLALLTVFQVLVLALDFRLRRNQHYMALAVTGAFLFWPKKRQALQVLLVLFYFWAGTLKLNREWLSGAGLYRPLWLFSGRGVVFACAYVIALELVVVWGLLARRRLFFWAALAQVVLFHVFSWGVVGFFYPLLMFGLLAVFPLCRLLAPRDPSQGLGVALVRGRAPRLVYVMAAAFSALQLVPHLYPGDSALTGEGRLFALHMFDARIACQTWATLKLAGGGSERIELRGEDFRTACDPVLIHGAARNLCRARDAGVRSFVELDLRLSSRRTTGVDFTPVIALDDFCGKAPRYRPFRHNEWIGTGGPARDPLVLR
jgi:hypothetical protein